MNEPAKPLSEQAKVDESTEELIVKKIKEIIHDTHSEELVISLCGFIGTDIHKVAKRLKYILENKFEYNADILEPSNYIKEKSKEGSGLNKNTMPSFEYIKALIDGGNSLREQYGHSILAELAIQKIAFDRLKHKEPEKYTSRRHCYIVDSLKNKEELELLRLVYRDVHYAIGVFSSIDIRKKNLGERNMSEVEIDKLIDRDSGEEVPHGQKVRDTFTQSDFFLRLDSYSGEELDNRLERFLNLIFCTKVITPTVEETAMYQAFSAAGNSACLSRQVGAALTDYKGEILSIGWNDVPKTGGGLYQTNYEDPLGKNDNRCYSIGKGCWNDKEKNIISTELVNILIQEDIVNEDKREIALDRIRNSKIKQLVEFSRAIHAEMHAIITGCQTAGERVKEGMLFITTYPCHNCARHIIVAGVKKVYYIEPYRKSLTIKLHSDAITEDEKDDGKVKILMYDGVAPEKYLQLFKMYHHKRKEENGSGDAVEPNLKSARPKVTLSLEAIPVLELKVSEQLEKKGLKIE